MVARTQAAGAPFVAIAGLSARLFAQSAQETDETKRRQSFSQIQRILERDLPDLNLVSPQYVTVYARSVHDATTSPDGTAASFANVWLQR